MAPVQETAAELVRRADGCPAGYYPSGGFCYRNSNWYWWGRWVFTGVIIVIFIIFLIILSRRARRQRRLGQPAAYTGWMGRWGGGPNPPPQYNNPNAYATQPPQYSQQPPVGAQYTGGTYNSNEGYYGQNANNIPLQPPNNSYYPTRGVADEFAPPEGPPPGKK